MGIISQRLDSGSGDNFGRDMLYFVTATFRRGMVDSEDVARMQLDGILADFMALSGDCLTMFWSLVEHNGAYHAHICLSWLPTVTVTRLLERREDINRRDVLQVLHDNFSFTDKPRERIKPITIGTSERVKKYVANQPNGGAVLAVGWMSESALAIPLQAKDSWHYSKHQKHPLKKCSECAVFYVNSDVHFYTANNGGNNLRGECKSCHNIKSVANTANYRARQLEIAQNLPVGALGRLTSADIRKVIKKARGRCYWLGSAIALGQLCIDHIVPLSLGGMNTPDNLCVTSRIVNSRKGDKSLHSWLWWLGAHGRVHELMALYPDVVVQRDMFASA